MGRVLFVTPEAMTVPLWDDGVYWVSVKRQLNAGEARQLSVGAFSRMNRTGTLDAPGVSFDIDPDAGTFAKVLIYLLDWNLSDPSGKTVPIDSPKAKRDALKALHPDVFAEIERAIDAHVDARAQEKKLLTGSLTSSIT